MQYSVEETLLIDTIEEVGFGRLCDVEIPHGEPVVKRDLKGRNAKLIKLLRDKGITELVTVIVHEGEAQQIEIAGSKHGIKFVKKIKL